MHVQTITQATGKTVWAYKLAINQHHNENQILKNTILNKTTAIYEKYFTSVREKMVCGPVK